MRLNLEVKLATGDHADVGVTERRHVHAKGAEHIGKEANRREERFLVGDHPEAQPTTPAAMPMMTSGPQRKSPAAKRTTRLTLAVGAKPAPEMADTCDRRCSQPPPRQSGVAELCAP